MGKDDEFERALAEIAEHGWQVKRITSKGYTMVRCACGKHGTSFPSTPSNPQHLATPGTRLHQPVLYAAQGATLMVVEERRFEVIFEGQIVVEPRDALHDVGLQVAEALAGDPIEDPFVRTDAGSGRFRVEVTVIAADEAEAFDTGVREISEALRSVVGLELRAPSAQASELVPA